jgi:hypothetical protein
VTDCLPDTTEDGEEELDYNAWFSCGVLLKYETFKLAMM